MSRQYSSTRFHVYDIITLFREKSSRLSLRKHDRVEAGGEEEEVQSRAVGTVGAGHCVLNGVLRGHFLGIKMLQ